MYWLLMLGLLTIVAFRGRFVGACRVTAVIDCLLIYTTCSRARF